jgi:sec-independent protein translocase protein TatB
VIGINGWEVVLLALIAVFVLGPERLPEYAAKLAQGIKKFRVMAEGAKGQLKDQLGPDYSDINWRQYDPRQYDPRRIVREALIEPLEDAASGLKDGGTNPDMGEVDALDDGVSLGSDPRAWDPMRPTPYDIDAT